MQDNQTLQKLIAKHKLGLPLTDSDKAFLTVYGEAAAKDALAKVESDNALARNIVELCDKIIAPIIDITLPIVDAIYLHVKKIPLGEMCAIASEYARKAEFVEKYLSPMLAAADMQIKSASYRCNVETRAEYIDIIYIGGHKRRVDVTKDSLQELIRAVLQ
ncbi:MAG: hypothetical protein K2M47_00720 [Clostridiales bacterium]|nr:hypothetical protein [Clostridiales bacterium]MDE6200392.1 hypothetical protein [Clostridiales bacterium]